MGNSLYCLVTFLRHTINKSSIGASSVIPEISVVGRLGGVVVRASDL